MAIYGEVDFLIKTMTIMFFDVLSCVDVRQEITLYTLCSRSICMWSISQTYDPSPIDIFEKWDI